MNATQRALFLTVWRFAQARAATMTLQDWRDLYRVTDALTAPRTDAQD